MMKPDYIRDQVGRAMMFQPFEVTVAGTCEAKRSESFTILSIDCVLACAVKHGVMAIER